VESVLSFLNIVEIWILYFPLTSHKICHIFRDFNILALDIVEKTNGKIPVMVFDVDVANLIQIHMHFLWRKLWMMAIEKLMKSRHSCVRHKQPEYKCAKWPE
jgi:hypothetical protein